MSYKPSRHGSAACTPLPPALMHAPHPLGVAPRRMAPQTPSQVIASPSAALVHTLPHMIGSAADDGEVLLTLPLVAQAWRHAAQEQVAARRLRDRPYQQRNRPCSKDETRFHVPLHALQRQWPVLTEGHKRRHALAAAGAGDLNVVAWAAPTAIGAQAYICERAALTGRLEVLQWARSQGCPWDEHTCTYAARGGHLEVLQWARSQGCHRINSRLPPLPRAATWKC
jgi:hypothetical protein